MEQEKKHWVSPRAIIDRYFLGEMNAYSKRRPINLITVAWIVGVCAALFVFGAIYFGTEAEKKDHAAVPDFSVHTTSPVSLVNQGVALGQGDAKTKGNTAVFPGGGAGTSETSLGIGKVIGGAFARHSANQVIRRSAGGGDPGSQLPMGQVIAVKLVNSILSTDAATPVIAEVIDDIYAHNILSIPAGSRVIGAAQYDEKSRRILLRFNTFVYPDGDQHSVQALGMMADGSAGLEGDYHSGESNRQIGRFLGHFASGMADGMKERQASGQFGMAYEPGSLKNGVLNGVALSAEDQAKATTEDLNSTKPIMTLASGQPFVLFLEREYIP